MTAQLAPESARISTAGSVGRGPLAPWLQWPAEVSPPTASPRRPTLLNRPPPMLDRVYPSSLTCISSGGAPGRAEHHELSPSIVATLHLHLHPERRHELDLGDRIALRTEHEGSSCAASLCSKPLRQTCAALCVAAVWRSICDPSGRRPPCIFIPCAANPTEIHTQVIPVFADTDRSIESLALMQTALPSST